MRSTPLISERHSPRAGFSLVELLIVMTIMAILASLSFVVLTKSGEAAREAATKTTMRILSGALREKVDGFHEITAGVSQIDPDVSNTGTKTRVFRENIAQFKTSFRANNPGVVLPYDQAIEAYVRKTMFKSLFPQRLEDLYGYNGVSNNGSGDDSPLLARMYQGGSLIPTSWLARNGSGNPAADSSELLYLILTEGDVLGLPTAELGGIDNSMIGDTDGDGNLEFLDGWGQPLQFYNWPTRLLKDDGVNYTGTVSFGSPSVTYTTTSLLISNLPKIGGAASNTNATGTASRNRIDRDPDDPARWLLRTPADPAAWLTKVPPVGYQFNLSGTNDAQRFYPTFYHDVATATMPLVVSAGPDGVLGLYLPTAKTFNGVVTGGPSDGIDRLARVIQTPDDCLGLGDNITNQQRGPK